MKLKIGDHYSFQKKVTDEDVKMFAEVSGDKNPLHLDDEYAKTTMFGQRIAHGMIGAGFISAAIGMGLPGLGTTYLDQTLSFKKPVFIGEELTAKVEVADIVEKKKFSIATLKTTVTNEAGDIVIEGEAKVIPPKEEL
ncbi:MAG: MaoC family dehydratase [Tissierellia bacterium]|nr:MaoC family dehydratase [Tissierellia bacterium]